MSRSLHTQKLSIRALRRLARPYSRRREEAALLSGSVRSKLAVIPRLLIKRQKPLPGMRHLLTSDEIAAFLDWSGPLFRYGLKRICLRQEHALRPEGMVFAEYLLSGEIHLYAVPGSPWRLPFLLQEKDRVAFARYGAQCEFDIEREQTNVHWAEEGLKRFALCEVLVHEIGHHLLQYHKGKRKVQVCRVRDHELRANLQSRRAQKESGYESEAEWV